MLKIALRFTQIFDREALYKAMIVLLPLFTAAMISGDAMWLQASLVTVSALIAVDRSGMAPAGVLLHGLSITAGFTALVLSSASPAAFVACTTAIASASVLVTAQGEELRSVGNFTFIPSLYLACETVDRADGRRLLHHALVFLPYLASGIVPVVLLSAIEHRVRREPGAGYAKHFAKILQGARFTSPVAYWETTVTVILAVSVTAVIVERFDIEHGQWVIWSAASVVTGDAASACIKFRDRLVGAAVGVPLGITLGRLVLPHTRFVFDVVALLAGLTFVAFRRYRVGFGVRCACVALDLVVTGHSALAASQRVANVVIGCIIGIVFVVAVQAIARRGLEPQRCTGSARQCTNTH